MRTFILLMNVVNRFHIKDCLTLFFIIDTADPSVSFYLFFLYRFSLLVLRQSKMIISVKHSLSVRLLNFFVLLSNQ